MPKADVPTQASLLCGLPALVSELGGRGETFLDTYGLDEQMLTRPGAVISLRLFERVLAGAAEQLGCNDFGLRMAGQQDIHILGPLAIAMENAPTMGDALECASRYLFVFSPAFSHAVIDDPLGHEGVMGIRFASSLSQSAPQVIDYGVGIVHRVNNLLAAGRGYGLRSVLLPHPRIAPVESYREYFGTEVSFDSAEAVLRVPSSLIAAPIAGSDNLLHTIAVGFLDSRFQHGKLHVSERILEILDGQAHSDMPDLAKVGRLLSLHPRSIQRMLAQDGVSFRDLVDQVRRERAHTLITTTDLPFSQIATRVGLGEQSSLTRAARRWFGCSPSALRDGTGTHTHTPEDAR
ncbi:AraC family transcriptional regulator [Nocardioides sp. NPDC051685]|uniref:AraC family transcriptional regulator n=1 Tax=Nocardioides sp. NPDC051685 TaxID=3364334 RepID=UPI0037B67350